MRSRRTMMVMLLSAFALQAYFVFTDQTGMRTPPLSPEAQAGYSLWRQNNCQTCHQLYGQGGHLGPDLTNIAARLSPEALQSLMASGYRQMPPYTLSDKEIKDLYAFLKEFNATGKAQAHRAGPDKTIRLRDVPWFDYR